jgi:hypothetical protein
MLRLFILMSAALALQDAPAGDAARLEEAVRALQRERKAYYERLDDREKELQEERRKLSLLEREAATLAGRRKALEAELSAARAENAKAKSASDQAQALEAGLGDVATKARASLEAKIKAGLPYELDRRLSRAAAGEGSSLERLEALRSALREEVDESREGAVRSEEVVFPDGRRKPSRVGRVGHQVLFFVTEDGVEGGVKVRGSWRMADAEELRDLKRALRILARQDAPGRATLPAAAGTESR